MTELIKSDGSTTSLVDVKSLYLDKKNFRIDYARVQNNQDVSKMLFEEENIIEMAHSIVSRNGLYPHEFLIVVKEDGKDIVMEGNRRVLAIRCLLDQKFVPLEYRPKFKSVIGEIDQGLKDKISKVNVVYMPREEALKIVADKHSDISYRKWSLVSQWRFLREQFQRFNRDIDKTLDFIDPETASDVTNGIKFINLIDYVRSLEWWDNENLRTEIEKNRLEPTRMTRALNYTDVQNSLKLSFDDKYEVCIKDGTYKKAFDYVLFNFAKSALIDSDEWAKINTRSTKDEIVSLIESWYSEYQKKYNGDQTSEKEEHKNKENETEKSTVETSKESNKKEETPNGQTQNKKQSGKKPIIYFSDLKCTLNDNKLKGLTLELSKITMTQFPAAAIMLTRSLLESSLLYQINKKGLNSDYYQYKGKDGLKKILNFSINKSSVLFKDIKSAKGLEYLENSKYKDFMDDIVHSKWITPTASDVANIAGKIRELLKAILSDSA